MLDEIAVVLQAGAGNRALQEEGEVLGRRALFGEPIETLFSPDDTN
ncbi:hypothetical protein ACGFSI_40430 [Streptomyces virginiae]